MVNQNLGFSVINGDAASIAEKTVLVLGIGRGGTSMTAGVLAKLGIYMGEELNSRFQDSALLDCINSNDKTQAKRIIRQRNEKFPVWGIKKLRLWRWDKLFREPVYVVIFRDLVATASRRSLLTESPLWPELFKTLFQQLLLLIFIRFSKRPLFIVSYEKAILYPEAFVQGLIDFLGHRCTPELVAEAVAFIQPSPVEYTHSPVNFRTAQQTRDQVGYIDDVTSDEVSGWALSAKQARPIEVSLVIDGEMRQTLTADLTRPDVAKADRRYHEHCGFVFRLDSKPLAGGEQIEIRFADTQRNLLNSPQQYIRD